MEGTVLNERTELYRKTIVKNKNGLLNLLENAPEVIRQLHELGVLGTRQLERLNHMPSLWTQREKLVNMLARKEFKDMDNIIAVLGNTNNQSLEYLLDFHRDKILQKFPKDDATLPLSSNKEIDINKNKHQPPITIKMDNPEDPEPDDSEAMPMKPMGLGKAVSIAMHLSKKKLTGWMCPKCSYLKLFRAASEGDVYFLKKLLESEHFERLEPCKDCFKKTKGQTLLHAAVLAKNVSDVVERVELLLSKLCGDVPDGSPGADEDSMSALLNRQDDMGQTAIHLAAENERSKVVEKLYHDFNCDILIKNKSGLTALDLINVYMPKVAWKILNKETLPLAKNNDSLDGNFMLEIDFGRIIGCPLLDHRADQNERNQKASNKYVEMRTLTKLVESNNTEASFILLSHVMVKTFLDLKWKKMSPFLYSYMCLKVLLYIWYTLFVVHVFLAKCPISSEPEPVIHGPSFPSGFEGPHEITIGTTDTDSKNILTYLVGGWEAAVEALTGIYTNKPPPSLSTDKVAICHFKPLWNWQPLAFLIIGALLFVKEILEAFILIGVKHKNGRNIFGAYWNSWENKFQVAFNILMILIGTISFQTTIPKYYYTYAALSIVVVWVLIFMQVGYLLGQGVYVQLLGKILKRFCTLMLNYLCWIIAFSIALSILFPHEKPFETLPKSFIRVITMMSGELNYENTFYGHSNQNQTGTQGGPDPSIVFTAHLIYISLALLLTIILSNALIGLVVTDVQELQEKAEVLLRTIKVDKMYTMEVTLLKLQRLCPCIGRLLNIFVVHPKFIWNIRGDGMPTGNGMVLKVSIKDLPKELEKEIREFALNPMAYNIRTEPNDT